MSGEFVQNNYNPGDTVYAIVNPDLKLVIRKYYAQVYYCRIAESPEKKELVYFERELIKNPALVNKNKEVRDQNSL